MSGIDTDVLVRDNQTHIQQNSQSIAVLGETVKAALKRLDEQKTMQDTLHRTVISQEVTTKAMDMVVHRISQQDKIIEKLDNRQDKLEEILKHAIESIHKGLLEGDRKNLERIESLEQEKAKQALEDQKIREQERRNTKRHIWQTVIAVITTFFITLLLNQLIATIT